MKIYISGDNFIIESRGTIYSAYYRNVIISKAFGELSNVPFYYIKNVSGWNPETLINVEDSTNDTGLLYTEQSFDTFYRDLLKRQKEQEPTPPSPNAIEDQIVAGVTDRAPSQGAVHTALQEKLDTDLNNIATLTDPEKLAIRTKFGIFPFDTVNIEQRLTDVELDISSILASNVESVAGKTGVVTLVASDIISGTFNIARIPTGITGTTVALGNHLHTGVYEPTFAKNTAFNKNFGTSAGTVAQGDDSRILNGQTAFTWGDHSLAGYLTSFTETDPTVPSYVKAITENDIATWNSGGGGSVASIPTWTASVFTAGSTVSYNNAIWRAKVDTLTTDVPATGAVWEAATDNPNGDVIHLEFDTPIDLIYTWKNYILEYVDGVSEDIRFSKNSGKTWTTWVNPEGTVARTHIFTDGTVMICMANGKVFNTKNFITVTESTVLDFDGQTFVPNATHFFSIMPQFNEIIKIDGVEMVAWVDYMITGATGQANYISRAWYSTDKGATLKCFIQEGVTMVSGEVFDVRHTHGLGYDTHRNKFVITSGDDNLNSRLIESSYIPSTDTWEHKLLKKGVNYKFGQPLFDENYTYFLTDYTEPGKIRGIQRCVSNNLASGAYEYVYQSDNEIAPLIAYYEDSNGNRILTGDGDMRGEIYYAKNDFDFKTVTHNQDVPLGMMTSVNYQGDQYIQLFSNSYLGYGNVRRQYINLTQAFRDAGITDFNQEKAILGNNNNTDFQEVKAASLTGATIKLHENGNSYNYSTPSSATAYTVNIIPFPKVNDFARCFINVATEPIVNIPTGKAEVANLRITAVPTTAGDVTVTLDGVSTLIAIDPATETTKELVATKIKNTVFTGWTTAFGGAYAVYGDYDTVVFTSTTEGVKTDATYSEGTTGATGEMATPVQGTVDTTATKIKGSDFIASTPMEMVVSTPNGVNFEYYFAEI